MNRRLIIGNLSLEAHEAQLEELFSRAGSVESIELISDPVTGRKKGFAFVEMTTNAEAARAKELFDGADLNGRRLIVNTSTSSKRASRTSLIDRLWNYLRR